MNEDISALLRDWPYDGSNDLMVRRVKAADGEPRLQIRLELGVLELHSVGRPDGQRPHGFDSALDYYLHCARQAGPRGREAYQLSHEQCGELHRESMQYYHRRISFLRLKDYDGAITDAEHNLAIMDLLRDHAEDKDDWRSHEQYRPFVLSHLTQAKYKQAFGRGDLEQALRAIEDGIRSIENLFRVDYGKPELVHQSDDLRLLHEIHRQLSSRRSAAGIRRESAEERLQRELESAVAAEEYERAAELRDALARLKDGDGD